MQLTDRRIYFLSLALLILLTACTAGSNSPAAPAIPGLAQTLAAQTLSARDGAVSYVATLPPPPPANPEIKTSSNFLPTATPEGEAEPEVQLTPLKQTQMARSRLEEMNTCTNLAEFVQDISVPDDTRMKPGQRFVKTWQFKNVGTCTWTKDYALIFIWGHQMDGRDPMPIGVEVAPEQVVNISLELVAPKESSIYQGNWMFLSPDGDQFGTGYKGRQFFWVSVVVGSVGPKGACIGGG